MKSKTLFMRTIINKLDFLKEAVVIQWNALKKGLLLLANKLIEKIPDPGNAKEQYQSFIRKRNRKSTKQ